MTTVQRTGETKTRGNPGLKFCIWPKAFVHVAQTVIDHVFEEEALNQEYRSYTQSSDVRVTNIMKPASSVAIHPRKLTWMLDNVSVAVRGQRKNRYGEENFEKSVFGPIEVNITVLRSGPFNDPTYSTYVNMPNLRFSCSSHSNGFNFSDILSGHSTNSLDRSICQTYLSLPQSKNRKRRFENVIIKAGALFCGNLGEPSTKRRRNDLSVSYTGSGTYDNLGRTLICALANAVLERLNYRLPDHLFPVGSPCDWMFNFKTLSKPEFYNGYLESLHLAAIYYNGDTVLLPTQAAAFPEPQNSNRMLTIFISNHVINTIGYCFHQHDILNYNLTQADLIPRATVDNSTTSDISVKNRCLSDCFPDFSVKYPGAFVEVNMASSEVPTSTFSGQNLKVNVFGSAIFRAHLADDSLVNFLTIEVNMEVTLLLRMTMEKLIGTLTSILPRSITVVNSALKSVNHEVLTEAFDLIATQFLSRKFDEISQKGIPLPCPLLSGVEEFENVEMWSADDFLRIDTDLKFHA